MNDKRPIREQYDTKFRFDLRKIRNFVSANIQERSYRLEKVQVFITTKHKIENIHKTFYVPGHFESIKHCLLKHPVNRKLGLIVFVDRPRERSRKAPTNLAE